MNILETIKTQLSTEQYNELVEYIETMKDEAYWDGYHAIRDSDFDDSGY